MPQLNQMELNSIRETVSSHQAMSAKFSAYANQCKDPQIKQMFQNASVQAEQSAQKLIQML